MRLLLAIHHEMDADSGASGTILELAGAYRALGHEVDLLSYENFPIPLPLRAKELLFPELAAWHLSRSARRFDVVDASTGDAWLWARARRLLGRTGPPLMVTRSHGLEHLAHEARLREAKEGKLRLSWRYPLFYGGLRLWEVAQSLRLADLAFFLNNHDRRYATARLGIAPAKCQLVRNGLPDDLIDRAPPTASAEDAPRIAMVGTYAKRKGVDYAMPALSRLLAQRGDLAVSFLGTGRPATAVLADLPTAVHDRVQVVERYRRSELPSLLAGHQVVLFASLFEGFGKAVLEAMACGLAPVCARSPGPTEFVEDGVNGLLVPPSDSEAIVAATERLLDDRELLDRLRIASHRTAQPYSWRNVAQERLSLYGQALADRPGLARSAR